MRFYSSLLRWLILFAGVMVLVGTQQVAADSFPGTNAGKLADSAWHNYCVEAGTSANHRSALVYGMTTVGGTTDINVGETSCGYNTDVWLGSYNLTGNLRGIYSCWNPASSTICNSSHVRLDFPQLDIGSYDWEDRRKTAVHEVGHSVGLGHYSGANAMMLGQVPDTSVSYRRLNSHHRNSHVNPTY